jgi:hypothetical protein
MRRLILTSLLLLTSGWLLAQYESSGAGSGYNSGSEATSSETGQGSNSSMAPQGGAATTTTVSGCLSEANGQFTLTDQSGTSYDLTGKTAQLKSHVGHTIRVTGKVASSGQQPGSMSGEQPNAAQSLSVISFRHVSTTCKNPMH